jgi:hypothetical protein
MMGLLEVRTAPGKGRGVYAGQAYGKGLEVLQFEGQVVRRSEIPDPLPPEDDHFLQFGPDSYLGPSGGIDDLVNHACDPNCAVLITPGRVSLVAIRTIEDGEEVTFDYSLTSLEPPDQWRLDCRCGSAGCRRVVTGFLWLPRSEQERLVQAGLVPPYVCQAAGL